MKLTNTHGGGRVTMDVRHQLPVGDHGLGVSPIQCPLSCFSHFGRDKAAKDVVLVVVRTGDDDDLVFLHVQGDAHWAVSLLAGIETLMRTPEIKMVKDK